MSLMREDVETKFITVDIGAQGEQQLVFILNGEDGPVALRVVDRTQRAQPRQMEFTHAQWEDLLMKLQTAFTMEPVA